MRVMGTLLFLVGIIAALISAAKLPALGANWSDMLPIYAGTVVLALLGLQLLRWARIAAVDNKGTDQPNHHAMALLQTLLTEMQSMGDDIHKLDGTKIAKQVNNLLDAYVLPFVAAQHEIIHLLGKNQGVDVLIAVAEGERLLNRMWSTASEGELVEAIATYPEALAAFQEAHNRGMPLS